jgi:putative phosphoribosyl transferase
VAERHTSRLVRIPSGKVHIEGMLEGVEGAVGIVVFAHGSGSSRHSPRNNFVAAELRRAGFATLLIDLLTPDEDRNADLRFAIELLTQRLADAVRFVGSEKAVADLPIGLFGASTGAAAALCLAAADPEFVKAVVSRGGRPDLAEASILTRVCAPTLLIVGCLDPLVIQLNEKAYHLLGGVKELTLVPGATHLFEEPGSLERVARLASAWFSRYLVRSSA